jgi:chromosome partitioning protein
MSAQAPVIVFASQKGGSGKTTLSGHIAVQALMSGFEPVAIVDTDPQASLAEWHHARESNDLELKVSDGKNIERDIQELQDMGVALIIVDTPPVATSTIGSIVRQADLVCIPARPSPHDLRALGRTIDIVEYHRRSMIFVLNGAPVRAMITREAALALCQHGTVASVIIHNRVDFAASMTDGRTVMEVEEGSRSSDEVSGLWDYIVQRLEKNRNIKSKNEAVADARAIDEDAKTLEPLGVSEAAGSDAAPVPTPVP